jgi:hypothetical protein
VFFIRLFNSFRVLHPQRLSTPHPRRPYTMALYQEDVQYCSAHHTRSLLSPR